MSLKLPFITVCSKTLSSQTNMLNLHCANCMFVLMKNPLHGLYTSSINISYTEAVMLVWRSRTSKVSGSCQKVSGSWRRLARRYAMSSSPEHRSTYAHARRTGVTSGGRSTLTPCQIVETEFMTPAATVLHNKSFLRAAAMTYFTTPHVTRDLVISLHNDHDAETCR